MTLPSKIYIDANLLVLLVVGETKREHILKHRRTKSFEIADFDRLLQIIGHLDSVFVTPNTLTEASNLVSQHREPERSKFLEVLKELIEKSEEIVVASKSAVRNREFTRLGLTDSVLLELVSKTTPLLTTDFDLYYSAISRDPDSAFNFTHAQFQ